MLNYIWLGLIAIAIFVAVGRDISEETSDRFRNEVPISLHVAPGAMKISGPEHYSGTVFVTRSEFAHFYGADEAITVKGDTISFVADLLQSQTNPRSGALTLSLPSNAPQVLGDAASAGGDPTKIIGRVIFDPSILTQSPPPAGVISGGSYLRFTPPTVHFRILAKVANDGILKVADTAVNLAIGLIGIMALWLGIMKIAEAAGLVLLLAKIVRPIMVRVFPDVPPDHPAMGAMVMNMAANFLGLSNAATPLGLKAMEELNKLNPVAGTATNAMCMFLTINTTALTLVPATVIAIRLTLGSSNPTDIIMPTFLATFVSLILGILFTRFIQRFFPIKSNEGSLKA